MVGYAFMGAVHSQAWRTVNHVFDLPVGVRLAAIGGRDPVAVKAAAEQHGWAASETDWRALLSRDDVGLTTLIPAFVLSELKDAFIIGFIIFIPFLIIDIVVSGALMALGMMMMPPAMVSLPFKLLLFVLVNGWGLIITALVGSYG